MPVITTAVKPNYNINHHAINRRMPVNQFLQMVSKEAQNIADVKEHGHDETKLYFNRNPISF